LAESGLKLSERTNRAEIGGRIRTFFASVYSVRNRTNTIQKTGDAGEEALSIQTNAKRSRRKEIL